MSSRVWVPTKEQRAEWKAEALANVRRMAFPEGMTFALLPSKGARTWRYIRIQGDLDMGPLVAWGRHAWAHGHRPSTPHLAAEPWLAAAQLLEINHHAAHMILAAGEDFPLGDPDIRAALLAKCGLEGEK